MNYLLIGRLIKPYGLKGKIKADFFVDSLDELDTFSKFYRKDIKVNTNYREIKFDKIEAGENGIFISVSGCNDRTQADELKGVDIFVTESELPVLKENDYYIKDLLELDVIDNGENIGKVNNIIEIANKNMLILKMSSGKELAVPFNNKYVDKVEIKEKRITVKMIEELL